MQFTAEELLTMRLRERTFARALSDLRVQGALIAASEPWRVPAFDTCRCCCYPTVTRATYDVCPNVIEDPDPEDAWATANDYPLNAARRNFIDWRAMYGPSDEGYAEATRRAAERGRLIEAYDALLPDVHPWTFIAALPRLDALRSALYEPKLRRHDRPVSPESVARIRAYREHEIHRALRSRGMPLFASRPGPPTGERRSLEVFTTIADGAIACVEAELGASIHMSRGVWSLHWERGTHSASLSWQSNDTVTLRFDLSESTEQRQFSIVERRAPEEIARQVIAFFNRASNPHLASPAAVAPPPTNATHL